MSIGCRKIVFRAANAFIYLCVVTSGHVTKIAVTPFDPPHPKTPTINRQAYKHRQMYETLKSAFEHCLVTEYDRWGLRNASKNE